jgi:hypothetical protein
MRKARRIRRLESELSLAYEEIGLLQDLLADAQCEREMYEAWANEMHAAATGR